MKIDIVCVGKLKEKFHKAAVKEYLKRLSGFCKIKIIEIPDMPIPKNLSQKQKVNILKEEGERLLKRIKKTSWCIVLDVNGKTMDSVKFSNTIKTCMITGKSHISCVIGGSMGLSQEIKRRAQLRLSLSKMTFTHQMTRIILLEQIYRAFKIMNNQGYHK